jgi:RNA polymerase sigma-70 factor (ECF subfamily)
MDDERAFLARAAWRLAVNHLKKARSKAPVIAISSDCETPEEAVIAADSQLAIHRLIDALPEELRQPLALSAVEELNSGQIAKVMGIPEGTVRTRLMRARQILKQKLAALMGSRYEKR